MVFCKQVIQHMFGNVVLNFYKTIIYHRNYQGVNELLINASDKIYLIMLWFTWQIVINWDWFNAAYFPLIFILVLFVKVKLWCRLIFPGNNINSIKLSWTKDDLISKIFLSYKAQLYRIYFVKVVCFCNTVLIYGHEIKLFVVCYTTAVRGAMQKLKSVIENTLFSGLIFSKY